MSSEARESNLQMIMDSSKTTGPLYPSRLQSSLITIYVHASMSMPDSKALKANQRNPKTV